MVVNLHCQFDVAQSHRGNKSLGLRVRQFLGKANEMARPVRTGCGIFPWVGVLDVKRTALADIHHPLLRDCERNVTSQAPALLAGVPSLSALTLYQP